ncbi:MAG: ribosome-associated translation inhibitor RaiA [Bacteroidales bacterium]|nr:ribosome-associated translation inhibitor RaiA [Bacteroidales bacterium]MDE7073194.1 ribosome-associated translation inhibitor RaiA [Bacteroidales bacterium]
MEISVNAVKFKAADALLEFIDKKVGKVETLLPQAIKADVTLKVDKEQAEMNKIAEVRVAVSGDELFASKQCDTFEEAVDLCVDALKKQVEKLKTRYQK